jgi:diguanylate cyclase (GGDEF)-like protein
VSRTLPTAQSPDADDAAASEQAAQRARLAQARLALILLVAGVATMHAGAWLGVIDRDGLWLWTVVSVLGLSTATLLIQLRLTSHLADPSLTLPQMLFASTCAAWAYTLAGTAHAVVTLMQALALSFATFGASARPAIYCAAYSIVVFGVAMVRQCLVDPQRFHPVDDLLLFIFLTLIIVGIVINTMRVNAMRSKIRSQKTELKSALERIRQLAGRDELTGLANRRSLHEALEVEVARSARTSSPWCVALIDLDHFKQVNDTGGHAMGDAVLRWFAQQIRAVARASDVAGRWGGEEFLLILPDTRLPAGLNCLERLKEAVTHAAPGSVPGNLRLTFSAGVAEHAVAEPGASTVERADALCYAAKRNGRNRIEG